MAFRVLRRQILVLAPRRQRSTAAAVPAPGVCPFHGREKQIRSLEGKLKPYGAIPSPRGLPFIGTLYDLVKSGGAAKIHEYCDMRHKELGPIFREQLGTVEAVVISNKELMDEVYSQEGLYPQHLVPEPWVMYNKMKGITRGLFFMDGEQWFKRRKFLNSAFLSAKQITNLGSSFRNIADDVVERWEGIAGNSDGMVLEDLEKELYNWSIECMGTVVFGRRLRCITRTGEASFMQEFVNHVQTVFSESAKLSIVPPTLAKRLHLPMWRKFVSSADSALKIARNYTEIRISQIRRRVFLEPSVLSQLLSDESITETEIVNIIADLILAAADTTSHATQWALYSLAKNPETQEKLLAQIHSIVKPGELLTEDHIDQIPYASWIIKESLRLYPIASFLTRILPHESIVGGYRIPEGKLFIMSQYTTGRNPKSFENPDKFIPERWQRLPTGERQNLAKGCTPFGVGARACIGRRVAELKMRLLIAKIVQSFQLESKNESEVGISLRMITTPDQPIKIQFQKRPV